jgi:FkbM family methyltransferase
MPSSKIEVLRRNASRARRLLAERRGDWSLSQPSRNEITRLTDQHLDFDGGVFLEAGAHDGFFQSNTYLLERKRGWTGVLIEPVPTLARQAKRSRRRSKVYNCALVDHEFREPTITLHHGGPMSIIAGTDSAKKWASQAARFGAEMYDFTVPARTLTNVLEDAQVDRVDFFSLDVEGFEAMVLRGLDFDRVAPRLLLVEVVGEGGDHRADIERVLAGRYRPLGETSVDVLYQIQG